MGDPRDVLGVNPSATWPEIRQAFLSRSRECHPDKRPESEKEAATKEFQRLYEAYEVLRSQSDPEEDEGYTGNTPWDSMAQQGTPFSADALHSIFLPRDFQCEMDSEYADCDVLASVNMVSSSSDWPAPYVDIIWSLVHRPTKQFMYQTLLSLEVGQAAAFWLRAQNAVLHVERAERHVAVLSTWRVQLPSGGSGARHIVGTHRHEENDPGEDLRGCVATWGSTS